MKVLEIYDKNSDLRYYNKNIFLLMDEFFKTFPKEYSDNYYRNLETLKLFKVDSCYEKSEGGFYTPDNMLFFCKKGSIVHELMHMASYLMGTDKIGFSIVNRSFLEDGLQEGMTEYLAQKALKLDRARGYHFESFCVSMLDTIPNIFKPYFIPNKEEFISLFPNERDIYSLMYSLNYYNQEAVDYINSLIKGIDPDIEEVILQKSIRDTLDTLIDIELSIEKDPRELEIYSEKYMDLLGDYMIDLIVGEIYPNYKNYANKQINKRIRSKR